jgi:iron complex outermembrane receptor protein
MSCLAGSAFAQSNISGVVRAEGQPVINATVTLQANSGSDRETARTNSRGEFQLDDVAAGSYTITVTASGYESYVDPDVEVLADSDFDMEITLAPPINVMEQMTVASASRRPERIVEAPAAVSVISGEELQAASATGQLPRALENTPGVELAQSGVFDFNVNARGFNSSLNRRILVLIDGRDPATGFLGNQEWSAIASSFDTFESMELVRGPGSALYGANAFNGVLNIRSKRPIEDLGGHVSVSGGELATGKIDFRYAGEFGSGWSYRVSGGYYESDTWTQSRTVNELGPDGEFEYPGLGAPEAVQIDEDVQSTYFGFRLDKDMANGHVFTFEAAQTVTENGNALTGIGRVQINESERPWARLNYNTPNWNIMYSWSGRNTPEGQTLLATGTLLYEDSTNQHFEIQANYDFFDGKVQFVGGAAYRDQTIDTANPQGVQTLMRTKRDEDQQALFGQIKWAASEKVDVVLAGRWDDNSLHEAQKSPKAAIVYKFNPSHSVRATYNEAFQTPNYSEYFLLSRSANVVPFAALQDAVALGGFGADLRTPGILDWQNLNLVAVGNDQLVPEQIKSFEIGYKGIIGGQVYLTVDAYKSTLTNFVTDLLPGANNNIPAWQFVEPDVPGAIRNTLIQTLQSILGPSFSGLTNLSDPYRPAGLTLPDGHPVLTASYTNAGEVDTEGIDIAMNWFVNDKWTVDANWSWFDYDVVDQLFGDALLPNASDNKFNIGFTYDHEKLRASFKYKYVEGFDWATGVFAGFIPDYELVNLSGEYRFTDAFQVNLSITNALDDEHFQIFGGSLNGRRALATLKYGF